MKVAIITPYHSEPLGTIKRCHDSVRNQVGVHSRHMLVADGNPRVEIDGWDADHYRLPTRHDDAGATPRALGALSAFSLGYDAVMFLDADNWYYSNHAQVLMEILSDSGADAVIATRNIHKPDGTFMYTDRIESNGENMIDTNTWLLTPKARDLLGKWIVDPGQRLWSDRHFAKAMLDGGMRIARSHEPTVAYATKWAWHYQHAGMPIPADAVWIDKDDDGNLIHVAHIDRNARGG